jgi:hypothetical protein
MRILSEKSKLTNLCKWGPICAYWYQGRLGVTRKNILSGDGQHGVPFTQSNWRSRLRGAPPWRKVTTRVQVESPFKFTRNRKLSFERKWSIDTYIMYIFGEFVVFVFLFLFLFPSKIAVTPIHHHSQPLWQSPRFIPASSPSHAQLVVFCYCIFIHCLEPKGHELGANTIFQ